MPETDRPAVGGDEASLEPANTHNEELLAPAEAIGAQTENHNNRTFHGNGLEQELPELIRETEGRRGLMSGMPSINLNELTLILRDPSMPSHTIMKEVADMIVMRSEESESDDGSVGSSVGLQGLLNCIFEVAYGQINSDDEDENFVRIPQNLPCNVCSKVFDNNMKRSTHVLVAHQDPSVLNISSSANKEANKERTHASHRRRSKPAPKSEAGARCPQTNRALRADSKEPARRSRGKDGAGDGENLSSESRSQHKDRVEAVQLHTEPTRKSETSPSRESSRSAPPQQADRSDVPPPSVNKNVDGEHHEINAPFTEIPSPIKQDVSVSSCEHSAISVCSKESAELRQDPPITACQRYLSGSADQAVPTDQIQGAESDLKDVSSGQRDNPPVDGGEQSPQAGVCCQAWSSVKDSASLDSSSVTKNASIGSSSASVARKRGLGVDAVEGRNKRTATTLSESPCTEPALNPKRARQVSTEGGSVCTKKEDL